MSGIYEELLTATIQHLEDLQVHGAKFVSVRRETLAALEAGVPGAPELRRPTPTFKPPQVAAQISTENVAPNLPPPKNLASKAPSEAQPALLADAQARGGSVPAASLASVLVPLSPEAKAAAMSELRERARACVKCPHLASSRKNVVFGVGDINSPLMFVGEAPGADEDVQGEPFVGKAGQLLTRIIQTMGFARDTVYIANVLKCRPDTPGQAYGNRKPTPEEMKTCLPYLSAQIDVIQPKVIVALGGTAVEGLLGRAVGITKLRGHWQDFRGIPLMPTFHPSFLLRPENASKKREVWEDMLQVLERLGVPINEKQRSYFLKP